MNHLFTISAAVILLSVFSNKFLHKYGVPALLIFLVLGMLFGSDGIGGIYFNDYIITEEAASVALLFIMFYGGFGTKWETARPIAVKAVIMSSLGTVMTAILTGIFCMYILKVEFIYGMLFGSVIASTDAASVFSILRSHKLNLKDGLAPLLEIESGSNDPFSYMLTIAVITMLLPNSDVSLWALLIKQIFFGVSIGALLGVCSIVLLKRIHLEIDGFYPLVLIALVILGYALCGYIDGNGFLCVYIIGIIIGNAKILNKVSLVHFFDAFSWLMQIMLFFILGLLSYPSKLPALIIPGTLIALFMAFIARPIATFGILSWFKMPIKNQIFVSWVGLRGAASIVFAIFAISALGANIPYDIMHLVLFVALFSVVIQGTLAPVVARKLNLVDESNSNSVLKTFNDYHEETHAKLLEYTIKAKSPVVNKMIVDADIPEEILIVMIKRGNSIIVPKGSTVLYENDILVLSGDDFSYFM